MSSECDTRRRTINTDHTPKFDEFPTTSAHKQLRTNWWFWLFCAATSGLSVLILLVLILSILFQGLPAFHPPNNDLTDKIASIDLQLDNLLPTNDASRESERVELENQRAELQEELAASNQSFFTKTASPDPRRSGIGPALMGSLWVCLGCAVFFLPLGVGSAIFLEEFKPKNSLLRKLSSLLQLNISNLAGVPSIVYGILGLTAFASMFGLFGSPHEPTLELGTKHYRQYLTEGSEVVFIPTDDREEIPKLVDGMTAEKSNGTLVTLKIIGPDDDFPEDDALLSYALLSDEEGGAFSRNAWYSFRLPFGRSVLAASLTLMLVILPVLIIATQEALRAVPSSLRQAALGLGCTPWQVVRNVTLPAAIPGIMTGAILSMSRAIGEAAPILMISGIIYITTGPRNLMDDFSILPLQIFYWAGLPIDPADPMNFQHAAAGGIIVLLLLLCAFNSVAITIRMIAQKKLTG